VQLSIYRDLKSIQPVRCFALLPHKNYGVGGAGFTIKTAIAKCRSEFAERLYCHNELSQRAIRPLGIAAHPDCSDSALQAAKHEVLETLLLEQIKSSGQVFGLKLFSHPRFSLCLARIEGIGYVALLRNFYQSKPLLSYSVRPTAWQALLKAWEESRNPHFHNTPIEDMAKFSKSTKLFSDEELRGLQFKNSLQAIAVPDMGNIEFVTDHYQDHHIAYAILK